MSTRAKSELELHFILMDLLKDGYRELKDYNFEMKYENIDAILQYKTLPRKGFRINVNPILKKAPINAIKGGIAHELEHIIDEINMTNYYKKRDTELYNRAERYRLLDEKQTDTNAIIRGYGKELMSLSRFLKNHCNIETTGLTYKEIRKMLTINKNN